MSTFLAVVALLLMLNLILALGRAVVGPRPIDRVASGQLMATLSIAVTLVLAVLLDDRTTALVALLIGLLGAVSVVALRRAGFDMRREEWQ